MLPIIDSVLGIVNKFIPDKDKQLEAAKELQSEMTKQMKLQQEVILKEANSESKLVKYWRPVAMYMFLFMILTHWLLYIVAPWFNLTFSWNLWMPHPIALPMWLVDLVKLGLGGYIGGRTAEKIVKILKG